MVVGTWCLLGTLGAHAACVLLLFAPTARSRVDLSAAPFYRMPLNRLKELVYTIVGNGNNQDDLGQDAEY